MLLHKAFRGNDPAAYSIPDRLPLIRQLLLFGGETSRSADLTLPHPRMHERAFVLEPLLEIAPEAAIPGIGPARDQLARCADQHVERIP